MKIAIIILSMLACAKAAEPAASASASSSSSKSSASNTANSKTAAATSKSGQSGKQTPFLDCDKEEGDGANWFGGFWRWNLLTITETRICCRDVSLPNDCECFDISENSGWTNTKGKLPQCPENLGVGFFLYTRENPDQFFEVKATDHSIANSEFDPSKHTKFVVHGWLDRAPQGWNVVMKNELLKNEDINVILVNWHLGSTASGTMNFWQAAANCRSTAAVVANLITVLIHNHNVDPKNIHLIGHSMGGEIVGYVGEEIQRLEHVNLARISGMDAAGPGYEDYPDFVHLNKGDADFVDLIHTDTVKPGLGLKEPHGDVDFYINDADIQPGCDKNPISFDAFLRFEEGTIESGCSHLRAIGIYSNSIQNCTFAAEDNKDCIAGFHAKKETCSGRHKVVTKVPASPFCVKK